MLITPTSAYLLSQGISLNGKPFGLSLDKKGREGGLMELSTGTIVLAIAIDIRGILFVTAFSVVVIGVSRMLPFHVAFCTACCQQYVF